MASDLLKGIVRIVGPGADKPAGVGFIVADRRLIITCSHVVQSVESQKRGDPRPGTVNFRLAATNEPGKGRVLPDAWSPWDQDDLAVLRISGQPPTGAEALPLGPSDGATEHWVLTWGYPATGATGGQWGRGRVLGSVPDAGRPLLQLTQAGNITKGFSGAPAWDLAARRAIGMIGNISRPDKAGRLTEEAYVTPTESLRTLCPELEVSAVCPYLGLESFNEGDEQFFMGRETDITRLLTTLDRNLGSGPAILTVLGPSGSGKSSLIKAGLVPRLRRGLLVGSERWRIVVARTTDSPLAELEQRGLPGAAEGLVAAAETWRANHSQREERLALVFDQFEEILVSSTEARRVFLGQLHELVASTLPLVVIVVVRDDFYPRLAAEALFLLERQFNVTTHLTGESLSAIVQAPAAKVGLRFEGGLVEDIVQDALEPSSLDDEPTAPSAVLPLLEYALTELWTRRAEGELTRAGYEAIGKVEGGIRGWANRAFDDMADELRHVAKRVLLDLVHVRDNPNDPEAGEEVPASRLRVPIAALLRDGEDPALVERVVRRLTAPESRLLVTGRDLQRGVETVEIIHDALLQRWPNLRRWLSDNRRFLWWRQQIVARARSWEADHDERKGLFGLDLTEAVELLESRRADLEPLAREYIASSQTRQEREDARLREETEMLRRQQVRLRDAVRMGAARSLEHDPTRQAAVLREVESPVEAFGWMECAADAVRGPTWDATPQDSRQSHHSSLMFNANGTVLMSRVQDDVSLMLWRVGHPGRPQSRRFEPVPDAPSSQVIDVWLFFDHERDRLISVLPNATIESWRIETIPYATVSIVRDDGNTHLLMGDQGPRVPEDYDHEYRSSGETIHYQPIRSSLEWAVEGLSAEFDPDIDLVVAAGFSARGRRVWTCHRGGAVYVWELDTGVRRSSRSTEELTGPSADHPIQPAWHRPPRRDILISPNGSAALLLDGDAPYGMADLLRLERAGDFNRRALGDNVSAAAFSPDSSWVATATKDGTAWLWPTTGGDESPVVLRANGRPLTAVAFHPDGSRIVTGSDDGVVRIWPFDGRKTKDMWSVSNWWSETIFSAMDQGMTVYRSTSPPGAPDQWQLAGQVRQILFDPTGQRMATTSSDGAVLLWDARQWLEPAKLRGHASGVTAMAFSQDGQWLATAAVSDMPRVWRAAAFTNPIVLPRPSWLPGASVDEIVVEEAKEPQGGDRVWIRFAHGEIGVTTIEGKRLEHTTKFERGLDTRDAAGKTDPRLRWEYWQSEGSEARFFPLRGERQPFVLGGITDKLRDLTVSQGGRRILAVTQQGRMYAWDADAPSRPVPSGDRRCSYSAVAFDRDGRRIAVGSTDGAVQVLGADGTGVPTPVGTLPDPIHRVEFSPDGTWVRATASGSELVGLSSGGGSQIVSGFLAVAFVPDQQAVLAVLRDGVGWIGPDLHLTVTPRFWQPFDSVSAISCDGRWIMTQSDDDDPIVWSVEGNLDPIVLRRAGGAPTAAASTPDGKHVVTGYRNGTVAIWEIDLDPESLKGRLWRCTSYCLTVEERRSLLGEDLETAVQGRRSALVRVLVR